MAWEPQPEIAKNPFDREIVRISIAAILLAIVASDIFWDGVGEREPITKLDENVNFMKGTALIVAFCFGSYLFFLLIGYIPNLSLIRNQKIISNIERAKSASVFSAHFIFTYGIVSGLFMLLSFSILNTPLKEWGIMAFFLMIVLFLIAYKMESGKHEKIEYRSRV